MKHKLEHTPIWWTMKLDMTCKDCDSVDTRLSMTVDRGGKLVRFKVDCDSCGGFSHYLQHTEINKAVKDYLMTLKEQTIYKIQETRNGSWISIAAFTSKSKARDRYKKLLEAATVKNYRIMVIEHKVTILEGV